MEVLVAATFLHDLARHYGHEIHGQKSAEMAEPILKDVKFPESKIPAVLKTIAKHDYTTPEEERESMESKILYDADKMDTFGVVGVWRIITFYYNKGTGIEEILEMLEKRWEGLALEESRKIAKRDFDYVYDFFVKF